MSFESPLEDILKISIPSGFKQSADLEKTQTENRFIPLDKAIKAQNAMAYSGKTGSIGQFLRGISELPVAERQAYLSDPANRRNYMKMLEDFRQGTSGGGSNSLLTPEFLSKNLGGGGQGGVLNQLLSGGPEQQEMPQQQQKPQQGPSQENFPYQPGEIVPSQQGQQGQQGQSGAPQQPENEVPVSQHVSQGDRQLYSAQMLANNHMVGSQLKGRADSAIAFEKTMHNLRPKVQKVLSDAVKYSGIYGRGKGWLDKFKNEQPEEYANFISARDSLIPLIGNGVRFIENMGQSAEAQREANNLVIPLQQLDVSPATGIKVFNNSMNYLDEVTQGVLDSAEPLHPGVRRKLAGVPKRKGDFIQKTNNKKYSDEDIRHTAQKYNMSEEKVRERLGM